MHIYKAEDGLSFPYRTFLLAIPYQMELLHDSWPGFAKRSMKPAPEDFMSSCSAVPKEL